MNASEGEAVRGYVLSGSALAMSHFNFGRVQAYCRGFLFRNRPILAVRLI